MAKRSADNQVVVHLDPRVALEAILLNRLQRIPRHRRQEWLRNLLVQGFRGECQTLRAVSQASQRPPAKTFTDWLTETVPPRRTPTPTVRVETPISCPTASAIKPFALLRKVIG